MPPVPLLAPEYLESLPAPKYTPDIPYTPWCPLTATITPTPLGALNTSDAPCTPSGPEYLESQPAPKYTPDIPYTPWCL